MDVAGQSVSLPALIALGVIVGFVAGLFGVGGGFILTPLLSVVLRVPLPIAVGSGLCQMVGTATVALLRHRKLGQGELRFDALMLAGSLVGVTTGARVVNALEHAGTTTLFGKSVPVVTPALYGSYVVFLVCCGFVLLKRSRGNVEVLSYVRRGPLARVRLPPYVDLPSLPLARVSAIVVAYVGLGLGFLSGVLGVGGGIALMPVLMYGFGFPLRQAAGTGIVVLLVTSVGGTIAHALSGNVHLGLSMVLVIGASVSAQFGALATSKLPAGLLRRGLASLVLLTIGAILWDLVRRFT
ncbi:MAG: sulfite exporter TauE/SafE family protein [Myxococcales bacterium]|nr:sulfite exporter TauE/SafE family protein [Myxococcales bacterium]MCB9582950.1 sulfite exporter TauE/SafE family protein [Polyangiaceae bacterium]